MKLVSLYFLKVVLSVHMFGVKGHCPNTLIEGYSKTVFYFFPKFFLVMFNKCGTQDTKHSMNNGRQFSAQVKASLDLL